MRLKASQLGLVNYNVMVHQACKNKYFYKVTLNRRPIPTK